MQNLLEIDDMDRVNVDGLCQINMYQTEVVACSGFVPNKYQKHSW
jgi:hypothetical protein